MDLVALALWVITALGGLTMATIWLRGGGPSRFGAGESRISPTRLGSHFGLAATGLVLWILHVTTDNDAPGWLALTLLPIVATIGFLMFMTSLANRGVAPSSRPSPPEMKFPMPVVIAHGVFAGATVVAVLIALVA